MKKIIFNELESHLMVINEVIKSMQEDIYKASEIIIKALNNSNKVILFGNGGSAADAQHIAAELTGRYKIERPGLPGLALTTDTSALTAIGNDYGFDRVFDRQVESLANPGDILIGISTSGNSKNVISALTVGKDLGCISIGLSGRDGGLMNDICDLNLIVPTYDTPRIQEIHILIGHIICQCIDNEYSKQI